MDSTRRAVLAGGGSALAASLAGCSTQLSGLASSNGDDAGGANGDDAEDAGGAGASGLPLRETPLQVADDFGTLREFVQSAGVPKDGIPPIDASTATFETIGGVGDWLQPQAPVFGLEIGGVPRAYPQEVLVWHEIVNDEVRDYPISVTYCPLTGSVLGFFRGGSSFGTTGNLLNSNLVMYDRATDSRWPQLLATAIEGPHRGASLRGFQVTWTTWECWKDLHPDTTVLTRDTGHVRNYDQDPYGSYNPKAGYYATQGMLYDSVRDSDRTPPKLVVIGARTASGAFGVGKDRLREETVITGRAGDHHVVAVYDPRLDTGYVYEREPETTVAPGDADGTYRVDGTVAGAPSLPLDRLPSFDVMWFAWHAFYPNADVYV